MVFLSNYLVFKIVLAALGRVDYPVAGDLELKYDTANKIYLSGGSLDYVDDATLYTTIGGETTSYDIQFNSLNLDASNEQILFANDAEAGDELGNSCDVYGEYAVVGASKEDTNGVSDAGSVYVYHRSGNTWTQQAKLTASDGEATDMLGGFRNLAIYGDTVVVGARDEDTGGSAAGSAYVFVRSGTTWSQQAILRASNAGASDQFGMGVAIYKDTIVIGAPTEDTAASDGGSLYVFTRSGTTWTQRAQLQTSNAGASDRLGDSVSIDGDTIIAGTQYEDTTASDAGSAYIFTGSGATWTQQAQIQASDAAATDYFGYSVSISGNTVVVGARFDDDGGTNSGSAYVFVRSGTTWTQQAKLTASDAQADDDFGWDVDIDKDHIVVAAPREDTGANDAGAVYVFSRSGSTWTEIKKIQASITVGSINYLGYGGAGIHDGTIITAAPNESTKASDAGAAYIYGSQKVTNYYITDAGKYSVDATIAGLNYKTNEVEVTSLNPGNAVYTNDLKETSEIDHGTSTSTLKSCSVSLDGTRVALGADNGRVKVYHLETGVWTLKKEYTKSTSFGTQVCLNDAGTRLFVSDPSDNSNTGKVYVYDYSGSAWGSSETHSWVSPNGSTSDKFGGTAGKGISCNSAGTRLLVVNGYTGSKKGYIFDYTGSSWNTAPTKSWSSGSLWWGSTCALNDTGDRAFIGYQNGVDIFHYDGSNWPTSATKNYTGSDKFGMSLTINGAGTRLLVGSYEYSSSAGQTTLYDYVGSSWNTAATQTISGPYGSNSYYGHGVNMSRDGKRYLVAPHNASTYFSSGGRVDMMEDTSGTGTFSLKQTFEPDAASEYMGSYQFHEGLCLDQKGYTAVIVSAGQDISRIYSSYPIPTLDFDNYNKLSLTNTPTNTSSKLFLGSNVYDIGTLTSDLTIETPGLYRGLVFDTSSNVAYFNKTTVGAIASTMASYEKQDQVLDAGTNAGYSNGDASQGGYGNSIDMSADGTRMVVGNAHYTDSNGRVWLYHLENGLWVLKQTWDGGTRLGSQVAMNEAGTRAFALYTGGGVKIWDYSSGAWDTSASGTYSITPGTISGEVPGVDCNKAGDVVIIGSGNSTNTWIYRLSGGSWSSEKNFSRRGSGVSMNGAGTRCFMGDRSSHKVWESNYSGGSWGTETEIIEESSHANYWPIAMRVDSAGETLCVHGNHTGSPGKLYERAGNGSWSASVSDIRSNNEIYGSDPPKISYDGTLALFHSYYNNVGSDYYGRVTLYSKSGSTWSILQTINDPNEDLNDYFGDGTGLAKTAKDRFVIAATGDDNAGTNYGAIYTYTNAIPDFISFDTYNKLSLSGLTNPTSKIHALPTGAESTTTYDIGTATNIYIDSAGTYTAEMKGASAFALDSNVVGTMNTAFTAAFHHGAFSASDYSSAYSTVGAAAAAGFVYSDTTPATYTWGTLNSVDTSTTGQTGYSWTPTSTITADVLMVAGGGGGGGANGGGGGAGGLVYNASQTLSGQKTIVVGTGGAKGLTHGSTNGVVATKGNNTSFTDLETAIGGGGGSTYGNNPDIGSNDNGGSGGGGGGSGNTSSYVNGGTGTSGQGNGGGNGIRFAGAGGGGAGGSGGNGSSPQTGGAGGTGLNYTTTFGTTYGDSGWFAGGGGGGQGGGQGGQGGGGDGGMPNTEPGYNGQSHTGGGGGGGNVTGGNGGSGIVVIRSGPSSTIPSLTFDTYNKLTFTGADTGSTYKLKYGSNTYDLGTISNVYIAHPGTYSAEIKGATNFALSSNVTGTVSEPTISGPVSIEWASLNYSNFDGSGGKAAIGTTGGILVLDGTFNTSATSPYVGTAIDITGASTGDHNFKYTIPFKPKSQSFELSFKASQPSSGTTFQVYLGYLTLNWSTAQGWNTSGDSRQKVVNLYAPAGSTIYLAGMTGQSLNQSSYTYDSTKPFVITSDTSTLKIEHNGNSKSIDLTATHEDSSGGTVADPEYYLWMAFDENSSNGLYNLSDVTYSVGGEVIKAFPTLSFDGYNKLSFSNIAPTTSNVTFDGNTYSIGTASNVYIENTGTYEAESKGTTTFALTSKAATVLPTSYIAFHYAGFVATDYNSAYSTKEDAAADGFVYADTPDGTYSWGTLTVTSNTTSNTQYTWTPVTAITADVLTVAGGGGGGGHVGGGGGAGGLLFNENISLSGQKTIVVGSGGDSVVDRTRGLNGNDTYIDLMYTVAGGGGGGSYTGVSAEENGLDGGSGGGGTHAGTGGLGLSGQGNSGGDPVPYNTAGGGGGAGDVGETAPNSTTSGDGGIGVNYSGLFLSYGDDGWFASGGGGGARNGATAGTASIGGGANGIDIENTPPSPAKNHTGGGGGGGYSSDGVTVGGSSGGSGIVIIRSGPRATSPSLTHDGYKLVVKNITPTSTSLRLGSNTYEIGSATNIYVERYG